MKTLIVVILLLVTSTAYSEDQMKKIPTREGVTVSFYYMKREGAVASVILLPGGAGGIGVKEGVPTSNNFLTRSRDLFASNGFNVAVVGKPSDKDDLDGSFRTSPEHIEDIKHVIAFLKKNSDAPVWIIGTSMGTISATAVAIGLKEQDLKGIVLTSSVTSQKKTGAVPWQKLEEVRVPTLVVHHEFDECKICVPSEASDIVRKLKNAPIKKEVFVKGGEGAKGNPCEALHWHGFIGMEKEVVDLISSWIKKPTS
jgi:pimeloyl-ACP methyl ester carboxylesterase